MRKKKIAVLHTQIPFMSGGAELLVKNLTIQLNQYGYQAETVPMLFKWYPESTLYDHMLAWRLMDLRQVNGEDVDLVIATKFPTYGIRHPNKICWLVHQFREAYDLYDHQYGLKYFEHGSRMQKKVMNFDDRMLPECKRLYTISNNVTTRLMEYNGIKAKTLYHPPSMVGRYISKDYGDYILSVGRIEPLKRNELLIQSLPFCDPHIKVKFAGRGSQIENLQKLAVSLGVQNRVEFLGFVRDEDLLELYANTFAVFFVPLDEDYGYITLEAFLSKRPVITSSDAGGVLEFVKEGMNGYICKPEPEAFAEKITQLYNDRKMCAKLGERGYMDVKDISWTHVIDELTASIK